MKDISPTQSLSSNKIGFIVVGLLAVAALGVLAYEKRAQVSTPTQQTVVEQMPTEGSPQTTMPATNGEESAYQNGEYTVMGAYTSPGGPEEIEVTLMLENGVIVDAKVVPQATLPISQQMQNAFSSGYEEFVIGRSIDEVQLTKVSGSSLTPKGFNDAVEQIKQEALS